jgi:hypothetical protein
MSERRLGAADERADTSTNAALRRHQPPSTRLAERRAHAPRTHAEVDAEYHAARDAWTAAMRAARSGRPADLAALAMAQEAYEGALAEKRRWDASPRASHPTEPDRPRGIDAIVGQEFARKRVHEIEERNRQKATGIRGLLRRLSGG